MRACLRACGLPAARRPLEELQRVARGELLYANYKIKVGGGVATLERA
jgi:hypothetical protein